LDGFGEMGDAQVLNPFEIGDGTGYFKDAIVGTGGQALLLHGTL
jgi:hypothetical protein